MEREEVVVLPEGADSPVLGIYAASHLDRYDLGVLYKQPKRDYPWNEPKVSRWFTCREQFHGHTIWSGYRTAVKYILFRTKSPRRVMACVKYAEDKLKLRKSDRIVFRRTNNPNVLAVYLSVWWRPQVRQQALSILLRAGKRFNIKNPNFEEITESNKYLRVNPHAFRRFMRGYTQCQRSSFPGWVRTFQDRSRKETDLILVKPDANRERAEVRHPRNAGRRAVVSGSRKPSRVDRTKVSVKRKGN